AIRSQELPVGASRALHSLPTRRSSDLMVLLDSVVEHNLRTMAKWCTANGFLFSPHGKTTMCPQLYKRQLDAGSWGITVAPAQQRSEEHTPELQSFRHLVCRRLLDVAKY